MHTTPVKENEEKFEPKEETKETEDQEQQEEVDPRVVTEKEKVIYINSTHIAFT